ncbi:2TM domain-containing protein [Dyadobacter luticola]|uniref:2TM domain-containing protein n=1 Tax=Dyadobacter luticola TaxID=1979387 RepID=A0A5R9KXJ9_9BACT|nr:2TM domain-containing protein [Dyadobacter luticola]TLV00993.1 2TM domain-containing protein [Dyadobacter luticola]
METPRDQQIWRKAKKRAGFKMHLRTYLIVNTGLWLLYLATGYPNLSEAGVPWPIFPMLGWGIGLASHYFAAYGGIDENTIAQREYEKLMRQS